jgi:aryl-alcohol dehydrogenase-like predicted oxidoreductase
MRYRKLGTSDLDVSVVAFGAWQLGDTTYWGKDDLMNSEATVQAAAESGINLFDTAEMYGEGRSEEVLGQLIKSCRDNIYVASKVAPQNCESGKLRQSCEASLKRLDIDRIDLYQVHWPHHSVPFDQTYSELKALQDEGKIREIGVSNFGVNDLTAWEGIGHAVSNQLGYNLLFRAIEFEVVPACRHFDVGILAYMPLLQGLLAGKYECIDDIPVARRRTRHFASDREQVKHGEPGAEEEVMHVLRELRQVAEDLDETMASVAMAWLLAQPGVTSAIVGARKPAQLKRNIVAAELDLPNWALARLSKASDPVKEKLGSNPDMWMSGENSRIR